MITYELLDQSEQMAVARRRVLDLEREHFYLRLQLAEATTQTEAEGITDSHRIAQAVRRVVGRWVGETYRRRPMIVPTVIPV